MKTLSLLLCLATLTAAAEDAPKRVALELRAGSVLTVDGTAVEAEPSSCYLDARTCVAVGKEVADLRTQVAALRESQGVPLPVVVGLVVGAIGAGYAVAKIAR